MRFDMNIMLIVFIFIFHYNYATITEKFQFSENIKYNKLYL